MTTAFSGARAAPGMKTVVLASAIGTTIEWYRFLWYGTAAALAFNKPFSPEP